jgi:hypothetical protein
MLFAAADCIRDTLGSRRRGTFDGPISKLAVVTGQV